MRREVNANYLWGYLFGGVDVEPQLYFWYPLRWKMVDNTLDEETEAGGFDERCLIACRSTLGYHKLVKAQKCSGNGLLMRRNGDGSSIPTRSRYVTTEVAIAKNYK